MKREFKVFKNGLTDKPVNICSINGLSANGKPFNKDEKIKFYQNLGYTILEVY